MQGLSQGDWEGKSRSKTYTPEQVAEINSNQWLFTPPNGESQKEVEERMLAFISSEILSEHTEGNLRSLIQAVLRELLGEYSLQINIAFPLVGMIFNKGGFNLFL